MPLETSTLGSTLGISKKTAIKLGIILLLFFATVFLWYVLLTQAVSTSKEVLTVSFLSVGQGDAIFIESPTGVQVLIDGGPNRSVLRELSRAMSLWDRSIDVVIATHPDLDHIGGLADVLERYTVGTLFYSFPENTTTLDEHMRKVASARGIQTHEALRGDVIDMGGGVLLTVLFPDRALPFVDPNDASIIAHLTYGKTAFLLTGDAPQKVERYLTRLDGFLLKSDVLKLGHHGSNTSSSEEFIGYTDPAYAVVSAGKDNRYGHPHQEVIERMERFGVITKDTLSGAVTFVSDGTEVRIRE